MKQPLSFNFFYRFVKKLGEAAFDPHIKRRNTVAFLKKVISHTPEILYFDYARMHAMFADEINKELAYVIQCRTDEDIEYYLSILAAEYRKKYAVSYCINTDSCTSALVFSLRSLSVGKGDDVIVPVNTYIATALAVCDVDARPLFCDVNYDGLMTAASVQKMLTVQTKVIIPVHLYGNPCPMDDIMALGKKKNIFIVEDAAQAHGATYNQKPVGSFGDTGCFSLHASKLLGGVGNGGMLITNRHDIISKMPYLQNPNYDSTTSLLGKRTPDQLNPLNAAIAMVKLRHQDMMVDRRCHIARLYNDFLSDINEIQCPPIQQEGKKHAFRNYTLRVRNRDTLQAALLKKGIEAKVFYDTPLHLRKQFKFLGNKKGDYPIAEKLAQEIVSLPNAPYLSDDEVYSIATTIRKFYGCRPQ